MMLIEYDALVGLVGKVNAAVALVSVPYVLYEAFSKHPAVVELKEKLELRRSQLMGAVAMEMAERLMPFWPRTVTRIIVETDYVEEPPRLSEDAITDMKRCLEINEKSLRIAIKIRGITPRVLVLHGVCFWLIFCTAIE